MIPEGFPKALALFRSSAKNIPAYRHFLKMHGVRPASIKTIKQFGELPVMDKKDYLYRYAPGKLFRDGKIPPMIYASSGSSGHPTFWFRGDAQEKIGAEIHKDIFFKIFNIPKDEDILVVICFSMGLWIAGNYTLAACRDIARQGYRVSAVTPGIEVNDVLTVLQKVAPSFHHVILAGYPPFIMDVVTEAARKNIILSRNTYFITAGDSFTEDWRASLFSKIPHAGNPLRSLVSIYGSADAGILGYETPLSIFLRRNALHNNALREKLFGDAAMEPAMVQYDPRMIYFEEVGHELLLTVNTATPLIRYNIRDVGRVLSWDAMQEILAECGLAKAIKSAGLDRWKLPFIIKEGRNDVAVTFYALNIYPGNIKAGLDDKKVKRFTSGQFFAFNKNVHHNTKQELCINVELAEGVKERDAVRRAIQESVVTKLIEQNIEYRKLYSALKTDALPKITMIPFGKKHFYSPGVRGILGIKGKKMKMVDATS